MQPKTAPLKLYTEKDSTRLFEESDSGLQCFAGPSYLSAFGNDLLRVTHAPFFRRLQGKTQLFPAGESDFFRNRLTHSLEVSAIAEMIALKIDSSHLFAEPLNRDLIRVAALCHDAGHPPFGHRGERVLARRMADAGGFEGNAQTLHLLLQGTKLIRKSRLARWGIQPKSRAGLNLTVRALASVLKYDSQIPFSYPDGEYPKGYYSEDADVVCQIKDSVTGIRNYSGAFRTIECGIMDIADDIAYSIFDLEDALHAGFVRVSDLYAGREFAFDAGLLAGKQLREKGYDCPEELKEKGSAGKFVVNLFWRLLENPMKRLSVSTEFEANIAEPESEGSGKLRNFLRKCEEIGSIGYDRSAFTFELMHRFIDSIYVELEPSIPALSNVRLEQQTAVEVECLKQFMFKSLIARSRVQAAEWRAQRIVREIFEALLAADNEGVDLLPEDFSRQLKAYKERDQVGGNGRLRLLCDFIAGMTERYALEFHGRLYSALPETLFKPL